MMVFRFGTSARNVGERLGRSGRVATAGFLLAAVFGCDLSVTNPGPTEDDVLDGLASHTAVVHGMNRVLATSLDEMTRTVAFVTKELTYDGTTGGWTTSAQARNGLLTVEATNGEWQSAQRARWVAEDGIRRFQEVLGPEFSSYEQAAWAHLYAGYANRILGENMCEAVIDGGAIEPYEVFVDRAEAHFTQALDIAAQAGAGAVTDAAHAGRASVRMWSGDWAGAVGDAEQVPVDFRFQQQYGFGDFTQVNGLAYSTADSISSLLTHTVYGTFFNEYYAETGDPRTPWVFTPDQPTADAGEFPLHRQYKYLSVTAPITIASGAEMRLILAEAMLRDGEWEDAMDIVNERRIALGVDPWTPSGLEEAWTALKAERSIELWMEGRRLWDLRRWTAEGTPGDMEDMTGRDLCFPVPESERQRNPNVPLVGP